MVLSRLFSLMVLSSPPRCSLAFQSPSHWNTHLLYSVFHHWNESSMTSTAPSASLMSRTAPGRRVPTHDIFAEWSSVYAPTICLGREWTTSFNLGDAWHNQYWTFTLDCKTLSLHVYQTIHKSSVTFVPRYISFYLFIFPSGCF